MKTPKKNSSLEVAGAVRAMEKIAPACLAAPGDKCGLHAGSSGQAVRRILLALEATPEVLAAAARRRGTLVVTHHPRFYRGISDLRRGNFAADNAAAVLENSLALFAAHTNLDIVPGGVNDHLADLFALSSRRAVEVVHRLPFYKLTVFVPETHYREVASALGAAGAGCLGEYRDCYYRVPGIGAFRPGGGARPFIGKPGELCEVAEMRLETIVPPLRQHDVEQALLASHPYEEPAYDFVRLEKTEKFGFGRAGQLSRPVALSVLARRARKILASPGTCWYGGGDWKISRVAVWSGSGVNVAAVIASGAEALICGELGHHAAEELFYHHIGAIVVGHAASENHILPVLQKRLAAALPGIPIEIAPESQFVMRTA